MNRVRRTTVLTGVLVAVSGTALAGPALAGPALAGPALAGVTPAIASPHELVASPHLLVGAPTGLSALPAQPVAPLSVRAQLASTMAKAFTGVRGSVSGYVVVDGLGVVLDRRGTVLQAPASTTKLITLGTALLTLGSTYRFATTVERTGSDGPVVVPLAPVADPVVPVAPPACSSTVPPPDPCTDDTSTGTTSAPAPVPSTTASPTTASPTTSSPATSSSPIASSPDVPPPAVLPLPTAPPVAADSSGTLHGDLVLVGAGDPTLSSHDLASLAASIRGAGVRRITGTLYLDDSHLDQGRGARGWKAGYVGSESGPLSALMVDGNHRSRSAAYLRNPDHDNLALFAADLAKAGVKVAHGYHVGMSPQPASGTIATHNSAQLSAIVRSTAKDSNNTYAEELLKDVGATLGTGPGSTAGGLAVERSIAAGFRVSVGRLVDGSGLSTLDRLTAQQETSWIEAVDTTPIGAALRSALPISCHDGTLAGRLCGGGVSGRVQAKTGTLDYTAALTGYTTTGSGRKVWFSFMTDRTNDASARAAIDRTVAALARSHL